MTVSQGRSRSKSLIVSILLYRCETCTLLVDYEETIQAFETKCLRNLLRISYLENKTNDWVRSKINFLVGPQKYLLATVKTQKLASFAHLACHDSLSKTIRQGTLEGGQSRYQPIECWTDNINDWTSLPILGLLTIASYNKRLEDDLC